MARQPNIILINCDDMGYGDLGCYGSTLNRTPVLDKMAENGARLTDFYMASPVCSPSRGGMMTGCYPPRIGFGSFDGQWVLFPGDGMGLSQSETTMPSLLKTAGYRTKIIGKWHCGDQPEFLPLQHGFDEYYGLPYSNDMGRQPGHADRPPLPLIRDNEVLQQQPDQRALTERYVEQANDFIHQNKEGPFFLYLAHMHVHLPNYAPDRFVKQSQNGDYGACVECVDWATACLLNQLEKDGLSENTLVIFTSDNGSRGQNGGSNKPLRGQKGTTWEGGQRVPCILYWPGHIQPGTVVSGIVSSIDFLPTLCAIAGVTEKPANRTDGIDLSGNAIFGGSGEGPFRETFYYYCTNNLEAVRHQNWKLHVHKSDRPLRALYDLAQDMGEEEDVSAQHPEVVEKLEALLAECREDLGDELAGVQGKGVRPIGRVANPQPLTQYDEKHPYIVAMYDKNEVG